MARTAAMRLMELMILKEDIDRVLEYLGKKGNFQFYSDLSSNDKSTQNEFRDVFDQLQQIRSYLNIEDNVSYAKISAFPTEKDTEKAYSIASSVNALRERELKATENKKRVTDAYTEALAFSNLKVSYSELEHLSFLTLRIGKIDPAVFPDLQFALGDRAVIVALGDDKSKILAASSKKGRFALDSELKRYGFAGIEVPKDFQGIPDDVLAGLKQEVADAQQVLDGLATERKNYAETHEDQLLALLQSFSIGMQVHVLKDKLEATQLVYRITGWIPESDTKLLMSDLSNITEDRIAIRQYLPEEIPAVQKGAEKVPVLLKHGKLVSSFERMIFSYGAPLYGTIDPTPMVAFFFTLLFGIMFGDLGQGMVFILIGVLLYFNVVKVGGWNKFGPVFMAIGVSSSVMGLLTGEFFANGEVLIPLSRAITGFFGESRDHILHLMPSRHNLDKIFMFFLFTIGVGFIINSMGLIVNIINQFTLKRPGKALFGKTGLAGALFFWYVVFVVVRVFGFKGSIHVYDWVIVAICLLGVFFAHPLERLVSGHRPVFENGLGTAIIEGLVEILEVVSSYLSNSVSFLRVGAFALAHAVLGFIIFTMTDMIGGSASFGGLAVSIIGNVIVIVLEGMIVAIQVIRLQYYEFFSKFFTETGKEFIPYQFIYKDKK